MNKADISYYYHYLNVSPDTELPFEQLQRIFLMMIKNFKNEEFGLDTLSNFASSLWPTPNDSDTEEEVELKDVIHGCAEISFEMRKIPELDELGQGFLSNFLATMKYYEKYKSLLN
jgi:hypothetical protein